MIKKTLLTILLTSCTWGDGVNPPPTPDAAACFQYRPWDEHVEELSVSTCDRYIRCETEGVGSYEACVNRMKTHFGWITPTDTDKHVAEDCADLQETWPCDADVWPIQCQYVFIRGIEDYPRD